MNGTAQQIERIFLEAGIDKLPAGTSDRFLVYLELLLRWNARLNLTALRTQEEILTRHFAECAFAAQHLPRDIATLLDFGSGAGFPGIPIALCRPEIAVTLAESQGKKAAFLREAVRTLEIACEVYAGRVEAIPEGQRFDAVSMRAVDKMETAVLAALPRAGKYVALLTTGQAIRRFEDRIQGLQWFPPISLPKAAHAVLLVGCRLPLSVESVSVPRGT